MRSVIHQSILDVPDHDFQDVTAGWQKYYWTPWRAYLERRR